MRLLAGELAMALAAYANAKSANPITAILSGDTTWQTQCAVYLNGLTGTATATVKASNFAIRKANAS